TNESSQEIAYLFDENMEYLSLPEGVEFDWYTEEDVFQRDVYILNISSTYINSASEEKTFEDGDRILLRYNTPVEKTIQIGIEKVYFAKKFSGYDYNTLPAYAEMLLINTDDSLNYTSFTDPYYYNTSLELTPFSTEYLGTYRDILVEINLTTLEQFAEDGYIDFTNMIFSVPNPAYELTVYEVAIVEESHDLTDSYDSLNTRVWQFTQQENFTSSPDPENDVYQLALDEEPLFYNGEEGKWLEYLKIYDDNYNYYSACLSDDIDKDNYQLWYDTGTEEFSWNQGFDKFQDYWGMQIELPALIEPNTTIYFDYCHNNSWNNPVELQYDNLDVYSLDIIYNSDYLLTPRYELWYDELVVNDDDYDYETEQHYTESFTVYEDIDSYTYTFETEYNFTQDFLNLTFYEVIGYYPNFTQTTLEDDDINYIIDFDMGSQEVLITDLISGDGLLNQFDVISVSVNFTSGPVSQSTFLNFSSNFNQTYLSDIESTFYDYFAISFSYLEKTPEFLLSEDAQTLISDYTSFSSIDYIRNTDLAIEQHLVGYKSSNKFINFEVIEDPYNVIYEADLNQDGEVDYKQLIDMDKDGRIDITKYGIMNSSGTEIIWYRVIQDFETIETTVSEELSEERRTRWFSLDYSEWFDNYFFAQRSTQEKVITTQTTRTLYYAVSIDDDLDGFTDSHVTYQKRTDSFEVESYLNEWTAFVQITSVYVQQTFTQHELCSLLRAITVEEIESNDFSNFPTDIKSDHKRPNIIAGIKSSYVKYEETDITMYHVDTVSQESLTYSDWDNGELVEARKYEDKFDNSFDILTTMETESVIKTLSIINEETGQEVESSVASFLITDPASLNWQTETWGDDDVPLRFET
ncbi:MAG: hypothetical protein ACW96X_11195, partial [Promethearchaeota archaeon]